MVDLERICSDRLNIKVLAFFDQHPAIVDTARGIATWLNCEEKQIKKVLNYLANRQVLVVHRTGATVAYAYSQDKKTVSRIKKILRRKS